MAECKGRDFPEWLALLGNLSKNENPQDCFMQDGRAVTNSLSHRSFSILRMSGWNPHSVPAAIATFGNQHLYCRRNYIAAQQFYTCASLLKKSARRSATFCMPCWTIFSALHKKPTLTPSHTPGVLMSGKSQMLWQNVIK